MYLDELLKIDVPDFVLFEHFLFAIHNKYRISSETWINLQKKNDDFVYNCFQKDSYHVKTSLLGALFKSRILYVKEIDIYNYNINEFLKAFLENKKFQDSIQYNKYNIEEVVLARNEEATILILEKVHSIKNAFPSFFYPERYITSINFINYLLKRKFEVDLRTGYLMLNYYKKEIIMNDFKVKNELNDFFNKNINLKKSLSNYELSLLKMDNLNE